MKKLLPAVALCAFMAGPALADGDVTLTDTKMDGITAGVRDVEDNDNVGQVADRGGRNFANTNRTDQSGNNNSGSTNGGNFQTSN